MKKQLLSTSRRIILRLRRMLAALLFLLIPAGLIFVFSDYPYASYPREDTVLKFTFKHAGKPVEECREQTPEDLARLPVHMRKALECDRTRHPVEVELLVDGERLIAKSYPPVGVRRDGASYAYETFPMSPGTRRIALTMRDAGPEAGLTARFDQEVTLQAGRVLVLDFDEKTHRFIPR